MEPETPVPKLGPEQAPREPTPEHLIEPTAERGLLEKGAEHKEQVSEMAARQSDNSATTVVVAPTTVTSDDTTAQDPLAASSSPAAAADDDLIEKEWVDRAKKIVSETRDDPYQQENAVTSLQKDYQKKRYGRELGDAN
jgi:hypothetical protein